MTATLIENDVEESVFEEFKTEEPTPCSTDGCEAKAEFKLVKTCCANVLFYCEPHFFHVVEHVKGCDIVKCLICGKITRQPKMSDLFIVTRVS